MGCLRTCGIRSEPTIVAAGSGRDTHSALGQSPFRDFGSALDARQQEVPDVGTRTREGRTVFKEGFFCSPRKAAARHEPSLQSSRMKLPFSGLRVVAL